MTSLRRFAKSFARREAKNHNNVSSLCALGHSHRSKLESSVCQMLQFREKAGELKITGIEVHCLICGPSGHDCDHKQKIEYVADFQCEDAKTGETFYVEAKGFANERWPMKRRLWIHYRTEKLEVWKGSWQRPHLDEVIGGGK